MTRFLLRRLLPALPLVALAGGISMAQPGQLPPRSGLPTVPAPSDKDDVEVLARGPIHEAYASTAELPAGGPVVDKRPPDVVEELPPDQKPDGDNVQWIPGYWQYDEERKDFIWISGFWRDAPPGRVWVPGGWQEVRGGFQWVSGFWNVPTPAAQPGVAPQAELEYLPPPPATLETGPTLVSPGDDHFYTPGCWVYRVNRYVWRPGFWVVHRPGWVWVPDHYRWTPCGYVFIPGYWDVPLERRGVLFAPVYFRPAVVLRPRFVYTPVYAVPAPSLYTSLFVRRGYGGYYFGDYFEPRYATAGFSSWAVGIRGSNFAVTVSGGRGFAYDPLWSYYSVAHRREPAWQQNITNVYVGRYKGDIPRPPQTLVQQTTIINNITNNNTTVVNNKAATAAQVTMLAPLADLKKASPTVALKPVAVEDRTKEQQAAKELRQVAAERRRAEAQLVARGVAPTKADDKPQQVKVELPKTVVARAQQPPAKEKAPPPAPTPVMKKPDAPTVPPTGAKPGDKPPVPTVPPKNDPPKPGDPPKKDPPKVDPPKPGPGNPVPPVGSKPTDPKPPVTPPKVDPPKPGDPPKGPPATPPKTDPPKVDPPKGPTIPPVGPKPADPPKPKDPPKTDPPKGPTVPPVTPPTGPKPKDPPKVDPPKVDPPKGPPVNPPTVPPIGPKRSDPPKGPPPKQDPPKTGPGTPMPPVIPPKNDPPKAPPPKADPPKPQPPAAPPPKIDPPKPPVTPPSSPPKVDGPPKADPPKGPGVPTRPTRGDDKKDDKKK